MSVNDGSPGCVRKDLGQSLGRELRCVTNHLAHTPTYAGIRFSVSNRACSPRDKGRGPDSTGATIPFAKSAKDDALALIAVAAAGEQIVQPPLGGLRLPDIAVDLRDAFA